jgi:hypothetical protein
MRPLVVLVPLLLCVACSQAKVSVAARSTDALALSAEDAAGEAAPGVDGGPAGDAPLLLHVVRTEVHVSGGADVDDGEDAEDEDADDLDGDTGWTVVSDAPRDVDLVGLSGAPDEIADGPVPTGRLTQLRLVLDPADPATLVRDGDATAVDVPSGTDSGLKLRASPPIRLDRDDEVELTVRFDGVVERADGVLRLSPTLELLAE